MSQFTDPVADPSPRAPRAPRAPRIRSKSSSQKKAANRANSGKSTGPRTEAGKVRSSLNAWRHGFYGHRVAIGDEEIACFNAHAQSVIRDLNPRDALEYSQAQRIASIQWRLRRIEMAEGALLETEQGRLVDSMRERAGQLVDEMRDEAARFHPDDCRFTPRDARRLASIRRTFTEPDDVDPAHALMTLVARDGPDAVERLGRLEHRLDTLLQRAWKQMRELQKPGREIDPLPSAFMETVRPADDADFPDGIEAPPGAAAADAQAGRPPDETPQANENVADIPDISTVVVTDVATVATNTPVRNEATGSATVLNTTTCDDTSVEGIDVLLRVDPVETETG